MCGSTSLLHGLPSEIVLFTFQLVDLIDLLRLYFTNSSLRSFLMHNASFLEVKRPTGVFVRLCDSEMEVRYFAINGSYRPEEDERIQSAIDEKLDVRSISGKNHD